MLRMTAVSHLLLFLGLVAVSICEESVDVSPAAIIWDARVPMDHPMLHSAHQAVPGKPEPLSGKEHLGPPAPFAARLLQLRNTDQDKAQAQTLNRWVEEDIKLNPEGLYGKTGDHPSPPPPHEEKEAPPSVTRRRRHPMPPKFVKAAMPPSYESFSPVNAQHSCSLWLQNATSACQARKYNNSTNYE